MGAHLFNRFSGGLALRLIRASWLNKVADLWNYARGGHCINWTIPDNPGPENGPRVDLDMGALEVELTARGYAKTGQTLRLAPNRVNLKDRYSDNDTVADVAKFAPAAPDGADAYAGTETDEFRVLRIGKSGMAARADHRHPFVDCPARKVQVVVGKGQTGSDLCQTLQSLYDSGELGGGGGMGEPTEYDGRPAGWILYWIPGSSGSAGTLAYTKQGLTAGDIAGLNIPDAAAIAEDVRNQLKADIENIKDEVTSAAEEAAKAAAEEAANAAIEEYSSQLGTQIEDALAAAEELNGKLEAFSNVDEKIQQFKDETDLSSYLKTADAEATYAKRDEVEQKLGAYRIAGISGSPADAYVSITFEPIGGGQPVTYQLAM